MFCSAAVKKGVCTGTPPPGMAYRGVGGTSRKGRTTILCPCEAGDCVCVCVRGGFRYPHVALEQPRAGKPPRVQKKGGDKGTERRGWRGKENEERHWGGGWQHRGSGGGRKVEAETPKHTQNG